MAAFVGYINLHKGLQNTYSSLIVIVREMNGKYIF